MSATLDVTFSPAIEKKEVPLSSIRFNEAVYPRKEGHDPATVERYAADIEAIEAAGAYITIAADGDLLDGRHRHLAYQTRYAEEPDRLIPVWVSEVTGETDKLLLAVELNSRHGLAFTEADRKSCAISLHLRKISPEQIAQKLSVTVRTIHNWLSRTVKEERDKREDIIRKLWFACYDDEEIGSAVDRERRTVNETCAKLAESERSSVSAKSPHSHDFTVPLYNVWKLQDKTNAVSHFGNSEATWVDNLLYLYTEPLNIVVDPFAGGGSTIDVCKKRKRRYWCSDRKPKVSRHADNEMGGIREHDLVDPDGSICLPDLRGRWGEVKLVYLDPPYWKQAAGQYSTDPTDLANMDLETFTKTLTAVVNQFAKKLTAPAYIALLLQPTQWNAPERQYTDHVADLIRAVKLPIDLRVQCPYESQQANAQMVEWAKANRKVLVLSRELVIWRVA